MKNRRKTHMNQNGIRICWYVKFVDGSEVIWSEACYNMESKKNFSGKQISEKEKWHHADICRRHYPKVEYYA